MFYYVTSIKKYTDGHIVRTMGLTEGVDPDDVCVQYAKFWRNIQQILKVEEAVWSELEQCIVLVRTGKFPERWGDETISWSNG